MCDILLNVEIDILLLEYIKMLWFCTNSFHVCYEGILTYILPL